MKKRNLVLPVSVLAAAVLILTGCSKKTAKPTETTAASTATSISPAECADKTPLNLGYLWNTKIPDPPTADIIARNRNDPFIRTAALKPFKEIRVHFSWVLWVDKDIKECYNPNKPPDHNVVYKTDVTHIYSPATGGLIYVASKGRTKLGDSAIPKEYEGLEKIYVAGLSDAAHPMLRGIPPTWPPLKNRTFTRDYGTYIAGASKVTNFDHCTWGDTKSGVAFGVTGDITEAICVSGEKYIVESGYSTIVKTSRHYIFLHDYGVFVRLPDGRAKISDFGIEIIQ